MVPNINERRLVVLFTEGLMEPLKCWLKAFDPPTLQEATKKARGKEFAAPTSKFTSKGSSSYSDNKKFQKKDDKAKGKSTFPLDRETLNDLRKKKLCFYCKGPYDVNYDCPLRPKGKANRAMWALYEGSNSDQQSDYEDSESEKSEQEVEVEAEVKLKEARL